MPKGQVIKLDFITYQDDVTGAEIIRLTPPDVICHRNYFYQKCFLDGGRKLIFGGAFETNWNYYLLDLDSQTATQLTEGSGDNTFGGFLSPDEKFLFYVKNERALMKLCLSTLQEVAVYQVPEEWVGYGTWVANSDCTKLVGIEIQRDQWRPISDWNIFREFYLTNPSCRLIRIDLTSGESTVLLRDNQWLGHPIYRPYDDNTVAFCHEGPLDMVDARMWLMDEDGSNIRKVKQPESGESYTHEFWVPDGSALIYVTYVKGSPQRFLCRYSPVADRDEKLIAMPACSHLMSNFDGSLIVGDGAGVPIDIADNKGYGSDNDPFLYLFDVRRKTAHRVAQHSSSWRVLEGDRQVTHPHPSFTPDEKSILYTSDVDGLPALYIAAIPDDVLDALAQPL